MSTKKESNFTDDLEDVAATIAKMEAKGEGAKMELVPFKLEVIRLRIENEQMLALRRIAQALETYPFPE